MRVYATSCGRYLKFLPQELDGTDTCCSPHDATLASHVAMWRPPPSMFLRKEADTVYECGGKSAWGPMSTIAVTICHRALEQSLCRRMPASKAINS
jgi:hypothetical protein